MIKASLSNLLVYYMSLLLMSVAVRKRLDQIQRIFLWEARSENRKLHLMKWGNVIKPKDVGGLRIGNLEFKNWALLVKRWWRFRNEREASWRKGIVAKYREGEGGWDPCRVPRLRVSGVWGNILK